MVDETIITQVTFRNCSYSAKVWRDDMAGSPREWDNLGTLVCFGYTNETDFRDNDEFLEALLAEVLPNVDTDAWIERQQDYTISDRKPLHSQHEINNRIVAEIQKKFVLFPVYIHDHSGISISTSPFSCRWDSGQAGWIYASKKDILDEVGGKYLTKARRAWAERVLTSEIKTLDIYYAGDVYDISTGEVSEEEHCAGFFGKDYAEKEAKAELFFKLPFVSSLDRFFPAKIQLDESKGLRWFHTSRREETLRLAQQEGVISYAEAQQIESIIKELL